MFGHQPEEADVSEIEVGQVFSDLFDDRRELVRSEVDVLDPDAAHRLHRGQLAQPLLSVDQLQR